MKSKVKSVLVLLLAIFSLQVLASNTTIKRSEDIGVVSGTISNKTIASIPLFYETSLTNMARVFGFNAQYPLQITLGDSTYQNCKVFHKDESYTAEEHVAFTKQHGGSRVELNGVQRHYGVAGSLGCTFTNFKVLASADEVANKKVEQKQTQQIEPNTTVEYALGDMSVSVIILGRNMLRFRLLDKDGNPVKNPDDECEGVAKIEKLLDGNQVRSIRAEIKKVGNKATLKNVVLKDGKCTVENVLPLAQ
ncbi:hypothetical protein [Thalassotalea sp. PP2-459]|uniref:hypothetical protein n=1 Tax=Thalassotalea sp. PP2-459 TaxID=1742724 RepID=UPI0009455E6B|nr:hypothetical protein [Thalassotalea sp. PP2-459]OKY26519.1 hypothetical protein BI291_11915 [Thalassotalea sp. PP2-459]